MKHLTFPLLLATLPGLLITAPTRAQEAGAVSQVISVRPLPGHASALEQGAVRHMEWYADSGGQWTWIGFEISMGERTGEYVWFTGGHTYADFDQPDVDPQANAESVDEKIAPHVSNVRVSLSRVRPEVSMIVADAGLRPLYEVITFGLNPGGGPAFMHFLGKLKEAFETTGAAVEYTVREVTQGATGAQWTVVLPHESFASMELAPDLLETLMEQVHGGFESDALVEMFNSAVSSVTSEVYVTRPDLSVNLPSPTD